VTEIFTDPATGQPYRLDPDTGVVTWLDPAPVDQTPTSPPPAVGPPPPVPGQTGRPRKKRRIFLWAFLAVQVIFVIWIISGLASASGAPDDCGTLSPEACNDAESIGTGIGVALVIGLWLAVDFILGVSYAIYHLAKRR
jgi:hypothetical protein